MSRSRVADIMTPCVVIPEDLSILEMTQRFEQEQVSGAPVVNVDGIYVGVISRTDVASERFLALVQQGRKPSEIKARDIMNSRPPVAVKADDPIDDAVELMDKFQIHRVFVRDEAGKIVGIVTALNVVSAMRYSFESYL